VALDLVQDGVVASAAPLQGTLLRKQVSLKAEIHSEGTLSKAEIDEILQMASDPGLLVPLEVKHWSRQQLELYVLSGGVLRPKGCSLPDERLLANATMTQEQIVSALAQASEWITSADALLIGSGAGMGVDSGLGTFRGGHKGVWDGLEAVGLAYEDICQPKWFQEEAGEPRLAWGFWNHCHVAYQESRPHDGYSTLRRLGQRCPLGFFSFTSNIDSHWIASGMSPERVLEVHGAVRWLQCSKPCCPDVWKAPNDLGLAEDGESHRVTGLLPLCPKCQAVARPNVQMFGSDGDFSRARRASQNARYDAWLKRMSERPDRESLRLVVLEVGCGLTVPTVRKEMEKVLQIFPQARLVRVNPENPGLAPELVNRGVSLPLPAQMTISQLSQQVANAETSEKQATFILWGSEGGVELRAPKGTSVGRLLRLAELEGMSVQFSQETQAVIIQPMSNRCETVSIDQTVPLSFFQELKDAEGSDLQATAVLRVAAKFSSSHQSNLNSVLRRRQEQVGELLDEMNQLFGEPGYQRSVRACEDKRGVIKEAKKVQFQVLPKYGIEANDKGLALMATWIATVQHLGDLQAKVDRSMDISFFMHMGKLPNVKASTRLPYSADKPPVVMQDQPPASKVEEEQQPAAKVEQEQKPASKAAKASKEIQPPALRPLTVALSRLSTLEDAQPERLLVECSSGTKVSELRLKVAEICDLDARSARQAKLLFRMRSAQGGQPGFVTAQEGEAVAAEMFITNIDRWPEQSKG
ncbi:unnamed protein product, partial [Polarella glacialis]